MSESKPSSLLLSGTSDDRVLDTKVIEAIKDGEVQKVAEWIDAVGADSISYLVDNREFTYASGDSEVNSKGMTALHYAAFYSEIEIVRLLLQAGADPTVQNVDEENALQCAVQSGDEDERIAQVAELLLQDKDDYIDYVTDGSRWTALLMAVYLNHPLTVQRLLDHGADPAIDVEAGKDKYRYSLALAASHEGPILKALLDTGRCNVNWEEGKYTALHIAVKFFKPENVKVLVENKANMFARDFFGMCPIHYCIGATSNSDFETIVSCLKRSVNKLQDDYYGYSLIHAAVIQGKTEYVRILRHKFNAGYSSKDKQGRLPIHYLYNQSDIQDLVDLLGDTDATINATDKKGLTPMHYAVKKNDSDLVKCLIENGADTEITATKQKQWLIHLATIAAGTDKDFETMVTTLKAKIPDFNISELDANNRTPLHYALDVRKFSRAKTLLKAGADSSLCDVNQKNCLHIAFHRGCPGDVVKMILKKHEGLEEARDSDGNTPLQYLSGKTPLSAIKALEELGGEGVDGVEEHVEVTFQCGKLKRKLQLPATVSAEMLLERAKSEFDRADVLVQEYKKDSDTWLPVDGDVQLCQDDTLKVKVVATKDPPLNQAIELRRLDMVKLLLVKGVVLDADTLMRAIAKEDKELTYILVRHAKDIKTPLNQVIPLPSYIEDTHHVTPQPLSADAVEQNTTLFRELIKRMPNVAKEALERCVQLAEDHRFTLDFTYILPTKSDEDIRTIAAGDVCAGSCSAMPHCSKPPKGVMENPLELMVENKCIELLQHPVVWTYLYLKWNALGFWFYFFKLVTFGIFLLCLSLFVLVVNDPQSIHCSVNASSDSDIGCGPIAQLTFSYIFAALVVLLAFYHLMVEFLRLTYSVKAYFLKFKNYLELTLYICSVLFVFNFANPCGCPMDWQWQVGIFVVFLGWMNLIFFASKFPKTGIYVLVFKEILQTFLSLVAFGLLLVIAFSLILFMMFYSPIATIASFSNIGQSFVKTMTMVTGELGYESLFGLEVPPDEYSPMRYFVSAFIMWIIFLVLVPIILNNMLVSLAVGDAKEVIENAELQKLILQVKTVVLSDEVVPRSIKNYLLSHIKPEMPIDMMEQHSLLNKLRLFIFGGINYLQNLEDNTYSQRRKEEQEEIRGQRVTDDDNVQQTQDMILQRLDQLFDLVMTNEEYIKKCQKHDQHMMRIIGKLQ